ncbi:MAG: glucose-6-phosphate isomerase [Clostridiales Family XIII bacterium]|jgi:glucose-6-phosphate isomerase|nr:glucose-6-phosphate isomerase [Clostridiales Family XIII bacterium]
MEIEITYEMNHELVSAAEALLSEAEKQYQVLISKRLAYSGWVDFPEKITNEEIDEIETLATEICGKCTAFVVIGIGGSYLGAKAANSFIKGDRAEKNGGMGNPRILYAGWTLSGTWFQNLLEELEDEEICIVNISKSGGTVEPSFAFALLRALLIQKYGEEEANRRTYVITDPAKGNLREEALVHSWATLPIPSDIGGRYSVLTAVGLLPMAVAGIDIREVLSGAKSAKKEQMIQKALRHACVRRSLQLSGKTVEVIEWFEPRAEWLTQWLLQLFGESEGKKGKGMLPVSVGLSRDLHSLGQFFQEGTPIFSETMIDIVSPETDVKGTTGMGMFEGRGMNEFNRAVKDGVTRAHRSVDIPVSVLQIPDMSAHSFGQTVYFLETVCAVTGLLMGIDPFDQPGVEAYKKEMRNILNHA